MSATKLRFTFPPCFTSTEIAIRSADAGDDPLGERVDHPVEAFDGSRADVPTDRRRRIRGEARWRPGAAVDDLHGHGDPVGPAIGPNQKPVEPDRRRKPS